MKRISVRGAAALVLAVVLSPAGLAAQETRGATIVVTKLDGNQQRGQLIAVKPDSLLLLGWAGRDISVGLDEIRTVRIVRRSPVEFLMLFGALAGSGAMGSSSGADDDFQGLAGFAGGFLGALGGAATGVLTGADRKLVLAGETDDVVALRLDILRNISHEGRMGKASTRRRRPRFRLGLASTMYFRSERWESRTTDGSWSFRGDVPPGETGPYAATIYQGRQKGVDWAAWGPINLAYDWTEHWSSEIELSVLGECRDGYGWAEARFVSTADGETYHAYYWYDQVARFDSVLFGLSYHPIAAVHGRRSSLEIGAAAGPARVAVETFDALLPAEKKTVLSARVHAAVDHYFTPHFSLGVFCSYRRCQATFPDAVGTAEASFWDVNDVYYEAEPLIRSILVTVPPRMFSRSGVTYGIRIGFRI